MEKIEEHLVNLVKKAVETKNDPVMRNLQYTLYLRLSIREHDLLKSFRTKVMPERIMHKPIHLYSYEYTNEPPISINIRITGEPYYLRAPLRVHIRQ